MDNSSSSLKNNNRKEENQYLDELGRVFGQKEKEYESIEEKSKDGRDNLFMSDLVGEKSNRIPFDFVKEQFFKTMVNRLSFFLIYYPYLLMQKYYFKNLKFQTKFELIINISRSS